MGKQSDELPVLIAQAGPLNGQRWQINDNKTIGRDALCDVIISDRQVSRMHARLVLTPKGILLEDLDSKNGTHLNGQRLTDPQILQDGDSIQIALVQHFTFLSSDATLPLDDDFLGIQPIRTTLLRLEKRSHRVWIGDKEVLPPLSVSQYKLLEILYDQQQRVVSRSKVIEYVWSADQAVLVSEQALDALVRRLRDRLASIDPAHAYISTIRGHGMRLDNPTIED